MTYQVLMVQVLIASPGDTGAARTVIRTAIEDWNALNSEATKIAFQPRLWERDVLPGVGAHPQAIINQQLVDKADVLIGTFWTRLGTATETDASGTAEEIRRSHDARKPTLIYFSSQPVVPGSVDPEQYARLLKFQEELKSRSIYDSYDSEAELSRKVTAHLTLIAREYFAKDVSAFSVVTSTPRTVPRANPIGSARSEREMTGVDNKGKPKFSTRYHFVITNQGTAAAENLIFEFVPLAEGDDPPEPYNITPVSRLAPGGSLSWSLMAHMGSAFQWDAIIRWEEDGNPYEETQTVRLN
ncbi:hypothetical protein F1C76_15990 [Geodermatophilaceae bacterium NBWT11]|nr:hypothetical protein F1C76_15990 [Geodermatophilaceae bacterium NBWT11]